ncbi:MAG TPA: hypothetical protein DIC23_18890 [Planctomycetaceae bacterium]|nr:hypothetical protein [Planctomycetaceae bacterium]
MSRLILRMSRREKPSVGGAWVVAVVARPTGQRASQRGAVVGGDMARSSREACKRCVEQIGTEPLESITAGLAMPQTPANC